ncbi:MAG: lipoate--protein ligase family protein [Candidatus Omnitrophica bacterium]|nr:lipoate--protein ligase family protein [Candidatus Omnitrophota bacterium]
MKHFSLIRSGALSAISNMALDEEIFKRYLGDGIGVLRLYRWQSPAFTYGFSQFPESQMDLPACAADGVEVVKRMTGGGILFHNDEITYSFVGSKSDLGEAPGVFVDYRNICGFLLRFYESLGLTAAFALEASGFKDRCASHELCSAAHEKYDIVIGGKKIGGNAQKRNRQVVFQHGSIPCGIDWNFARKYLKFLPDGLSAYATTLAEELKVVPEKDILEEKLIEAFARTFNVSFTSIRIPPPSHGKGNFNIYSLPRRGEG